MSNTCPAKKTFWAVQLGLFETCTQPVTRLGGRKQRVIACKVVSGLSGDKIKLLLTYAQRGLHVYYVIIH